MQIIKDCIKVWLNSRFWSVLKILYCTSFPVCPQNVYVNINRIMSVGNRLLESGHYASQQIQQISGQLEQEWKAFAAALDERSTLLEMSASFHQKADQVWAHAVLICKNEVHCWLCQQISTGSRHHLHAHELYKNGYGPNVQTRLGKQPVWNGTTTVSLRIVSYANHLVA